jgi:ATP-binding cassette, subfamily C (CFTR/MRP), member 1
MLTVCSIPQLRWEVNNYNTSHFENEINWAGFQFINYTTFFTFISVMLVLNCFSDKPPKNASYPKSSNPSPEISASFLRRIFFQWFTKTTWTGWRRPLTEKDVFDINVEDSSAELYPQFAKYFKKIVGNVEKNKSSVKASKSPQSASISPAIRKAFGGPFWFSGILRLVADSLLMATPLLLGALINFIRSDGALWKGIFLTLSLFLVTFLQAIFNGQYFHNNFQVGLRIRSGLVAAIYRKALKISSVSKRSTTVGEIVNLMAVDAQRFFELMPNLHILWSGPLIIGVSIYLLWQYLGIAVLSGLAVTISTIPISVYCAYKLKMLQIEQMRVKDERIKFMGEILSGMKVLKLYAWEPSFEDVILDIRRQEMRILKSIALYNAATYFIWSLAPFLIAMASFITFVMIGGVLDPEIAFVSIALFNILRYPMTFCEFKRSFLI